MTPQGTSSKETTTADDDLKESPRRPMRDRIRAEVRRILEGFTQLIRSTTNRQRVEEARSAVATVVEGGIPLAIGTWVAYFMSISKLDSSIMTNTSDPLHPGTKRWIANGVGMVFGPLMAQTLPQNLHDNGIFLGNKYNTTATFPEADLGSIKADIENEGWYVMRDVQTGLPGDRFSFTFGFSPSTIGLVTALSIAWAWGLQKVVEKSIEKVLP